MMSAGFGGGRERFRSTERDESAAGVVVADAVFASAAPSPAVLPQKGGKKSKK